MAMLMEPHSGVAMRSHPRPVSAAVASRRGGASGSLVSSGSSSSLDHLSSSARRRVFVDPVGVGAYLAAEGRVARVQAAHRTAVDLERRGAGDSDDDDGATGAEDAASGGRSRSAAAGLKLNRRMQGAVPEFFECLRATLREVGETDEQKRQTAAAAAAAAGGDSAAAAAASGSNSLLFDAGPLTRALNAKASASAQVQARRDATKREAQLRKLRPPGGGLPRPDDADEADKRPRAHDAEEDAGVEDESAHHRLCLPQICVPPTIVYHKGVATHWYFSSGVDGSIKRKHARNLSPDRIVSSMAAVSFRTPWQTERPLDVVAAFYHSEPHLPPMYLGQEGMAKFVREDSARIRASGVLQKFVPPQAEYNSMLRVTWSPSMCLVERRTSSCKLDARRLRVEERVQTYEVATGLGVEVREEAVHDSSNLRRVIHDTCNAIAEHFTIVHGHTIAAQQSHVISNGATAAAGSGGAADRSGVKAPAFACHPVKMTLYWKLGGQGQLFLLLCDELRWSKVDLDEVERASRKPRRVSPDLYAPANPQQQQLMVLTAGGGGGGGGYRSAEEKEGGDESSPDSAALLDAFAARRRHIEQASRAHSKQLRMAAAAAAAAAQQPSGNAAAQHQPPSNIFDVIPGPLDTRQKRGQIKCGHCAVTLTAHNSALSAAAAAASASALGGGSTAAPPPPAPSSSTPGRPSLDLHSLLLYRLTLCLHLLPASPPAGSTFPPAHWANLQTIRSAFFWNLVRPILVPAYMDDEKELKVHLYFMEAQRMREHRDRQRRERPQQAGGFDDDEPVMLASPSAAAVGRAVVSKSSGGSSSTGAGAASGVSSIWDTRIYVCRACSEKIRTSRRNWSAAASPIHSVFDTLLDAYIEHERLRNQLPAATALGEGAMAAGDAHAPSPRAIAAHARALARLHLGPPDKQTGAGGGGGGGGSGGTVANIYAGPPLRSPNPALPLPPSLPQAPTIDGDGELSWPVHSSSSATTLQVAFGSTSEQGFKISGSASGAGAGTGARAASDGAGEVQPVSELSDSWFSGHERFPGERVRTLLQADALNPSAQTTSLLAELTQRVLEGGPGSHLNRHEREKARAAREGFRDERRERQARHDADAARAERREAAAADSKFKARYQHVQSRVMLSPEAAAQQRAEKAAAHVARRSSEDDDEEDYNSFGEDDEAGSDGGGGDLEGSTGKLSRAHERILARLARLDPVRARVIRSKAEPGGGALAPHAWHPDKEQAARVKQNLEQQRPEQLEADEAEWERVKAQLREWQRKQHAKEAAARVRAAELAAADASRSRPRSMSRSASAAATGTATTTGGSSTLSQLPVVDSDGRVVVAGAGGSETFDPSSPAISRHMQSNGRPPLFGPVALTPLQHKLDFKPYRSAERVFVSGTEMMLARRAYGSEQQQAQQPRSRSVSQSPTRRRRGAASPSQSPHYHALSQSPGAATYSDDEHQDAAVAAAEAALLHDRASALLPPHRAKRASSAQPRSRALAHSHSAADHSALALPPPPRARLSSATHSRSAANLHGTHSPNRPPTAAESSRAILAAQVLTHGYDNAAAFASATSPYQQSEQQRRRELRGFVPAGWDHARQASYSTRFGQRGKARGSASASASRPATAQVRSLEHQRLQAAEARALGLDADGQREHEASAPFYSPPKSLAVYATQSSVGLGSGGGGGEDGGADSSLAHSNSHLFLDQAHSAPSRQSSVSRSRGSGAPSRLRTPVSSASPSRRSSESRSRRERAHQRVASTGAAAAAAGSDSDEEIDDAPLYSSDEDGYDGADGHGQQPKNRAPWADTEQETLQAIEEVEKRLFQ